MNQTQSGGFPVDFTRASGAAAHDAQHSQGANGGRPENNGLADTQTTAFDGGHPGSQQDGPRLDGGKP